MHTFIRKCVNSEEKYCTALTLILVKQPGFEADAVVLKLLGHPLGSVNTSPVHPALPYKEHSSK
jgi:hypothetical protein